MTQFQTTLRHWRQTRRLSQLDLALEAEVSARHISFLETGRARPSPDMISRLSEAMELPLPARNQMLTEAGFAPRYKERDWSDADMAPIRAALDHTLKAHAPYPAIAVDRLWVIMDMNAPAERLFGLMGITVGSSLIDLLLSDFAPQMMENWPEVAHHAARRLRTESASLGGVAELDAAAQTLSQVEATKDTSPAPIIPAIYRAGDLRLSLFGTIAQFGTPEDLTLADLKIELFFPADAETEALLRAM